MSRFLESVKKIFPKRKRVVREKEFGDIDRISGRNVKSGNIAGRENIELISQERYESLLEEKEYGIIKSNTLEYLRQDPWNSAALKRMGELSVEMEQILYYLDALKSDPGDLESLEILLAAEAKLFIGPTGGGIENLVVRTERILDLIDESEFGDLISVLKKIIQSSYVEQPYKTRGLAVGFFRAIAKYSGNTALSLFLSLKDNLIDDRIRNSALTCSKRESRLILSLSLVDHITNDEERELERMGLLIQISEVIFDSDTSAISQMLVDCEGNSDAERLLSCLEIISAYSEKIHKLRESEKLIGISEIGDIVKTIRRDLIGYYEDETLYNGIQFEVGNFENDLITLPLFSIDYRVNHEVGTKKEISKLIKTINRVVGKEKVSPRRKEEIIFSSIGSIREDNPEQAINLFENYAQDNDSNERILRHAARTYESLGNLEEAMRILSGAKQRSSISLLERIEKISGWIKDGYDLNIKYETTDDFSPEPGKIMYCVHSSQPFVNSGYTIRTEEVVSSLSEKGFDVGVFCRWGFPKDRQDYHNDEVLSKKYVLNDIEHVIDPDLGGMSELKDQEYVHRAAESLLKSALIFEPSLIYSASDHSIGLAAAIVSNVLEIPFVYEMRGLWAYSRAANNPNFEKSAKFDQMIRLERQCAKLADSLFVISESLRDIAINWGVDPDKIEIVPNGVSKLPQNIGSISNVVKRDAEPLALGYVGSIVPYEGLELIVEAALEINKRSKGKMTKYTIVGDGSSIFDIQDLVKKNNLEHQFEFTGRIPYERIGELYSDLDVILIPRLAEKVCEIVPALKPLEAMKYGKLVVCSDIAPSKELILDGVNGFLFDKGDSNSLADVIETIIDNRDLIRIGEKSKLWVEQNRQWAQMTDSAAKSCARLILTEIFDSSTPDTKKATELISILLDGEKDSSERTQIEFEKSIQMLNKPRDRKNSFLAFLRELGDINPHEAINFGKNNLEEYADRRSIRSLITYGNRVGETKFSEELLSEYSKELDQEFTKSQEAKSKVRKKKDAERRVSLGEVPRWYDFEVPGFEPGERYELSGKCFLEKGDVVRSALCRFEFYNAEGDLILEPPQFLYKSGAVGYYNYLSPRENQFCIPFSPPNETKLVRAGFQTWEKEAIVSMHPDVEIGIASIEKIVESFDDFRTRAKESYGSDVIFMFSGTTFMNKVRANRPIRLTRVMLDRGNHVIFNYHRFNPRDEIPDYESDNLLQIPIDVTTEFIEEICEADYGKCRKVLMISYPHPIIPKMIYRFKQKGWVVIYDARDDWEEFSFVGQAVWYRSWSEKYIVRNSDMTSAVSWPLAEKLSAYNKNGVKVIPNALSPNFREDDYQREINDEAIVGYFGHLTDSWFDWESLIEIAVGMPEYHFEIIGHSEPQNLDLPENLQILGPKSHPEINKIARRWKAAIIPFKTGPLSDAVDPIKIYEYLALGLPTVSFSMPQIDDYPLTKTVKNVEEFKKELQWAVNVSYDMDEIELWLGENTWEKRVDSFEEWYGLR